MFFYCVGSQTVLSAIGTCIGCSEALEKEKQDYEGWPMLWDPTTNNTEQKGFVHHNLYRVPLISKKHDPGIFPHGHVNKFLASSLLVNQQTPPSGVKFPF